jgi:hypothetical protein
VQRVPYPIYLHFFILIRNPSNTMYCVPIPDINNPPTAVPIVMPKLPPDRNKPLAKSGASGAADVIQY